MVIDLPETGLVVFTGDNSNGKSVIVKTLEALLTNKIAKPRKRNSLVNREASYGTIKFVRSDDVSLEAHIQREAAGTYIRYSVPGEEDVVRYIADKSYKELLLRFGWHYDEDTGISLNVGQEEDELLFYKTQPRKIRSLLESAVTDTNANTAAENMENFLGEVRKLKESYNQQQRAYMQTLSTLVIEDTEPLIAKTEKLEKCYRNLSVVYFPNIPDIKPVPVVHYIDMYTPKIPKIKFPRIVWASCDIPDITKIAAELKTLREHKCPTCGRGFDEDACENPIHNRPS